MGFIDGAPKSKVDRGYPTHLVLASAMLVI